MEAHKVSRSLPIVQRYAESEEIASVPGTSGTILRLMLITPDLDARQRKARPSVPTKRPMNLHAEQENCETAFLGL